MQTPDPQNPVEPDELLQGDAQAEKIPQSPDSAIVELISSPVSDSQPEATHLYKSKSSLLDEVPTFIGPKRANNMEDLALMVGSHLGHFEIVSGLGAGGMAAVLKARDLELGRLVALKILPPMSARDPDAVSRFKQEARAAARLDHENVARVFFYGEDRGLHFIAFEYVEGETLRSRIDHLGVLSPADAVRFLLQCSAGLQHAFERGVVHRDVKPSNIVLTPDGGAKLIDMGLARHLESHTVNGGVTQSGVTLGTFDYISPEQARDPRQADVRSDIYSLGCAFYHALTGRAPVPEGTAAVKLQAQQFEQPTDPRLLNPKIPDALAMVLSQMMMKEPSRRYQTPALLMADLAQVGQLLGVSPDDANIDANELTKPTRNFWLSGTSPTNHLPYGILTGLAVFLIALIYVLTSWTSNPDYVPPLKPWADAPATLPTPAIALSPIPENTGNAPPNPGTRTQWVAETVNDLLQASSSKVAQIQLKPGVVYDLTKTAGLVFNGDELLLQCPNSQTPAILRVGVSTAADLLQLRTGSLTILNAKVVKMQNLRVEFVEMPIPSDSFETPVGVYCQDVERLEISECQFLTDGNSTLDYSSAWYIRRSDQLRNADVSILNSFVALRRWTAFELEGPMNTAVTQCGFVTSRSAFQLRGETTLPTTSAQQFELQHSTFYLERNGVAISTGGTLPKKLQVGFNVFASPALVKSMMMDLEPRPKVWLPLDPDTTPTTWKTIDERPNAYYRVEIPTNANLNDRELSSSPWLQENPLTLLNDNSPWKALELNPGLSQLRVNQPVDVHILGAVYLPNARRKLYENWPPGGIFTPEPKPGEKVWWPNPPAALKASWPRGISDNLSELFASAKDGDIIWIRANGAIEVPTTVLNKTNVKVTLRPYQGYTPILMAQVSNRADVSLFRLDDGELILEGLQFLLRSPMEESNDLRSVSLVTVAGGKRCTINDSAVTLEESKSEKLSVFHVLDVSEQMRKTDTTYRPNLRINRCFIRGQGRVLWMPVAIPVDMSITNAAIVTNSSVQEIGAPKSEYTERDASKILWKSSTILCGESFLDLRGEASLDSLPALWLPVQMESESCLYMPLSTLPLPFIRVRDGDPMLTERYLSWKTGFSNAFVKFPVESTFYEVSPADFEFNSKRLAIEDWLMMIRENRDALKALPLQKPPKSTNRSVLESQPADLKIQTDDTTTSLPGAKVTDLPKAANVER